MKDCFICEVQTKCQELGNGELEEIEDLVLSELLRRGIRESGKVTWCVQDILDVFSWHNTKTKKFTKRQAKAFLDKHEGHIKDAMVSAGWDVITTAIDSGD